MPSDGINLAGKGGGFHLSEQPNFLHGPHLKQRLRVTVGGCEVATQYVPVYLLSLKEASIVRTMCNVWTYVERCIQ